MFEWTVILLLLPFSKQAISLSFQVSDDCLPKATMYLITAISADEEEEVLVNETVDDTTFALQGVSSNETYSVTVVPSNTLGFGTATSTSLSKSLLQ